MKEPKLKTVYVCSNCGETSPRWMGRCPSCGSWNTMNEDVVAETPKAGLSGGKSAAPARQEGVTSLTAKRLADISTTEEKSRILTGISELDRVLGGGIVLGGVVLLSGEPGVGKSTMLLQLCGAISNQHTVLYITGEESVRQVKLRAARLKVPQENIYLAAENDVDEICGLIEKEKPELVVIDSIQTMYTGDIDAAPGSVSQVRECTSRLLRFCKERNIPTVIIGHVTKEGNIAGPRMLEHMVDVVLYFEGERSYQFRILRSIKNRFGSTSETGIFAMVEEGLQELSNPSASLLAERSDEESGSAVMIYLEGVRPILVEVQSLVVTTAFGMPRRTAIGYDLNRLIVLLAVLEKRCGFTLGNKDVYVNVIGGLKVNEPACDLSMAVAIVSNLKNRIVPTDMVILGEVGLTGNVRSIPRIEQRINEAKKLGFKKFIIPEGNYKQIKDNDSSIKIRGVKSIQEAMQLVFS